MVIDILDRLRTAHTLHDDNGVEYLQPDDDQTSERQLSLVNDAQILTRAATPQGFPFLVISRVRKDRTGHQLTVNDVLGGVGRAHDPDCILLLERTGKSENGMTPVRLTVGKARDGEEGFVDLGFCYRVGQFVLPPMKVESVAGWVSLT